MAGRLGDDGTLDTVIVCSECGQEARYNYDATGNDDRADELHTEYFRQEMQRPMPQVERVEERVSETLYDEFVTQCIADFDESHDCPEVA